MRCSGPVRFAGLGVPVGIDLAAGLSIGEALGYDLMALGLLLPMAEPAIISALHARAPEKDRDR